MAKLLSVGLDVGTTTTQMILSELQVENEASGFAVPKMQIASRKVLYRSPVHFTPLLGENRVDGEKLRQLILQEYENAGISPAEVDTGAVIITGETSRKENAAAVLEALSGFAGDFVAATAGPDLESILAAKGAGAQDYSQKTGKTVLHMDIGGGTSNLALIKDGKIIRTGCLNVGGRLLKFHKGKVAYVSPVLEGLTDLQPGDDSRSGQVETIAQTLTQCLEMAAGLRPETELLNKLLTKETAAVWEIPAEPLVISFSGGVADCIETVREPGIFGDMGVELGQAIQKSRLCEGSYILGQETIRATVIGAGSHSAQLSGSTVFCRGIDLPLKNLPVLIFSMEQQPDQIRGRIKQQDADRVMLSFSGFECPTYAQVAQLGQKLMEIGAEELLICMERDMAKALGQYLCLQGQEKCLCIDGICPAPESYLDIGKPVGPALPVVIKTLVLEREYGT